MNGIRFPEMLSLTSGEFVMHEITTERKFSTFRYAF